MQNKLADGIGALKYRCEDAFFAPTRKGDAAVCSLRLTRPQWIWGAFWMVVLNGLLLAFFVGRSQAQAGIPERACDLYFSTGVVLQGVPVAETIEQQARGLSNRRDVGVGMLFTWVNSEPRVFWMRDTFFPLSIGFFDGEGLLFAITKMEPNTDTYHFSVLRAADALELEAGGFAKNGLGVGDRLIRRECYQMVE